MSHVIQRYMEDSLKSSVVHELDASLRKLFSGLDELQALHKLLNNELETSFLVTSNLTGLGQYQKALLLNYGTNYQPISDLFTQHYTVCDDIIKLSSNKIMLAEQLDIARAQLLQGLSAHRLKDVELTYHITHDPKCKGLVLKMISIDKEFKKAIEERDKKFDELHSKIYAMIRVQQEMVNTMGGNAALIGNSANANFINMVSGRTEYLNDLLHKCIKKHQKINDTTLRDVFKSFEKYREYNNIDINFKAAYVSDGTFDENFRMYKNLSSALEKTIGSLAKELDDTQLREKMAFDARQKKVLLATNPVIVSLEGKRSAVKRNLNTRAIENVSIYTNIQECIKKNGQDLEVCFANLKGIKENDISKIHEYQAYADKLKKMKGMTEKYYQINATLARKIVEIAQYQEKDTLNSMVNGLVEKNKTISELEKQLADEKARAAEAERNIREKAFNRGYSLDSKAAPTGENGSNVLEQIRNVGNNPNLAVSMVGGDDGDKGTNPQNVSSIGSISEVDAEVNNLIAQAGGGMGDGIDDNINSKTEKYAQRAIDSGLSTTMRFGPVIIRSGISPESLVNNESAKIVKESNPLLYMMTGGTPGLFSSVWKNPLTGYQMQMNVIEGGLYGNMLRNEYNAYDKCIENNKILLKDALHRDITLIRALPDSDPRKAPLYAELLKLEQNIDHYAKVHACGTTYERMINGINNLGFDRIMKQNDGATPADYSVNRDFTGNTDVKKHGKYTPLQVEQMLSMLEMYIECYNYMLMDFDSRCRNTEDLIQSAHDVLAQMVLDLQNDTLSFVKVKHLINDVHKGRYATKTGFMSNRGSVTGTFAEPTIDYSIKDFVYVHSQKIIEEVTGFRKIIVEFITKLIKKFEDLKTRYRYYRALIDKNEVNYKTYYSEYKQLLDEIYTVSIESSSKPFGNSYDPLVVYKSDVLRAYFSVNSEIVYNVPDNTSLENVIDHVYSGYIGVYQALTQIIFIIYANVNKYQTHHLMKTQDRINQYATLSREYFNMTLRENAIKNELVRINALPKTNDIENLFHDSRNYNIQNNQRFDIINDLKNAYVDLDKKDTRDTFKKFTSARRLNAVDIPHTEITRVLSAIGKFQDNLLKYSDSVAKECNVIGSFMNQYTAAYKTLAKMQTEKLFYRRQLHMIEVFNLPKQYHEKSTSTLKNLDGLYPTYDTNPDNSDQKTNFEFIVFLGRRMLENGTITSTSVGTIGFTGITRTVANDLFAHVKDNHVIRGGGFSAKYEKTKDGEVARMLNEIIANYNKIVKSVTPTGDNLRSNENNVSYSRYAAVPEHTASHATHQTMSKINQDKDGFIINDVLNQVNDINFVYSENTVNHNLYMYMLILYNKIPTNQNAYVVEANIEKSITDAEKLITNQNYQKLKNEFNEQAKATIAIIETMITEMKKMENVPDKQKQEVYAKHISNIDTQIAKFNTSYTNVIKLVPDSTAVYQYYSEVYNGITHNLYTRIKDDYKPSNMGQ